MRPPRGWTCIDTCGGRFYNRSTALIINFMPIRAVPFVTGQIYHIYNRGSEKRLIYEDRRTFKRFLKSAVYYQHQGPKPKFSKYIKSDRELDSAMKVKIIAYCLMPNHYHFLVKQLQDGGITEMFSKLGNSYTKYFNIRYDRVGPLFQGEFKAVLIQDDEQLLHVSRYIHLNPVASYLVTKPECYEWSSYNEYMSEIPSLCFKDPVMELIGSKEKYKQFVDDQIDYSRTLEFIKHQLIDN